MARARGFEPRSKVLETSILPLNYARKNSSWPTFPESQLEGNIIL